MNTRIEQVIHQLLPATAIQNQFAAPAALEERMAYYQTPGVSIAVVNDGKLEWAEGFGVKVWGEEDEVSPSTLFQAGSISKPIFAFAVMKLVEKGVLDLDQDVNDYLTTWKVPQSGAWQPKITLRQLLSHTAGLTVHGFPGYLKSEPIPTLTQILNGESPANTGPVVVNTLPGLQFRYSGGGTTIAQLVVMDILQKEFPKIMKELVLEPLQMQDSTYEQFLPPHLEAKTASAHPYKYRQVQGKAHIYPEMAAAGLWSTASDLAKVGITLQQALRGQSQFFNQETVETMLTRQIEPHISLGFFIEGEGENTRFYHSGWDEGFIAKMIFYKHLGYGAVIMINSNQGLELINEIERAIATEYAWPGYFPEEKQLDRSLAVNQYIGEYISEQGLKLSVIEEYAHLYMKLENQDYLKLHPASDLDFLLKELNTTCHFSNKEEEEYKIVTLKQNGRPFTFTRS